VNAAWLEGLVWADVRRFLNDPGEVLERLRNEHDGDGGTEELDARKAELSKRLAAKQAEKDRYVRAYARDHISEDELGVYLADLKPENDQTEARITYRFGPPPAASNGGNSAEGDVFGDHFKKGSLS
jgi:hypothetical protein